MLKQPCVWRVTLPSKVNQFGATFELWGDVKIDVVGALLKAPLDDDDDILFVPDNGKTKEFAALRELVQKAFDEGA
jgi:hypothetical protein